MSLNNCAAEAGKALNQNDYDVVFNTAKAYKDSEGMTADDAAIRALDELIARLRPELKLALDALNGRAATEITSVSELSQEPIGSTVNSESSQLPETSKESSVEFKSNVENTVQSAPDTPEVAQVPEQLTEAVTNVTPEVVEDTQQSGALASLSQKSPEGTLYKARNLLADYFVQSNANEQDATQRPLVAVKDFLSQLSVNKALEFLSVDKLESKQIQLLKLFKSTAKEWFPTIQANLTKIKDPDYRFKDLTQFLLQGEDKDLDLEENVKTAMVYGAVSWIVESASRPRFNGPKDINTILDREETHQVSEYEYEHLGHVGARQNAAFTSLGQAAVQALGLKTNKDAKGNLMAQLESQMGAHITKLLLDLGIVERVAVSGDVFQVLMGEQMDLTGLPTEWAEILSDMATNPEKLAEYKKTGIDLTRLSSDEANAVENAFATIKALAALPHQFIKLALDEKGAFHSKVQELLEAVRGTQGVLDKMFSVESGMKEPSHEPIAYKQSKTKNTGQDVPSVAKPILEKENAVASYVHPGMWQFASIVDTDTLLEIAGAEDLDGKHAANIPGMKATNDGLLREITNFKAFVGDMMTKGMPDLLKPLYFDHTMWLPQRVGIATNLINPQSSKVHRHMLYRQAWETEIDLNDEEQVEGFILRVGEGLGVKTDKQDNAKSLMSTLAQMDEVNNGVTVLVRMLENPDQGTMSSQDQKTVLAAVKLGKEKMHSLASLMALAQMKVAVNKGESKVKVQLMGEVDGVTNGPMLSHLLLGAADTVKDMFSLLNRGGFYQQGSEHENYNLWRAVAGHFDLYETTAGHMTETVQRFINDGIQGSKGKQMMDGGTVKLVMGAIYGFTGELKKDDRVTKDGRDIIKTPLTAMVFGSSVGKAVQSMSDKFVSAIYKSIEAASAGKANALTREQIIENLNVLLSQGGAPMISTKMTLDELMSTPFTLTQIEGLQKTFKNTLGKAVRETMEVDFEVFIAQRKAFNTTAQITHEVYNAAYTAMHEQILNEQMDLFAEDETKGIPFSMVKGERQALHDLSAKEVAEIRKRLADLTPVMHTPMSKDSKQLSAGLYIGKKERKLSTRNTFKGEVKFGTGIKGTSVAKNKGQYYAEQTSFSTTGFETVASSPGASMSPISTHATDSATMHYALLYSQALNVHDAQGVGIGGFTQAAQSLNQSLWKVMLDYSPANEIYEAMSRTVRGYAALASTGALPSGAMIKLVESLKSMAEKDEGGPEFGPLMVTELLKNAKRMSFKADSMKLETMSQMVSVDQYALQGGNYTVTETDREAATAKRAELTEEVDAETIAALKQIEDLLRKETMPEVTEHTPDIEEDQTPAPVNDNPFTKLGTSSMVSDPEVVGWFKKDPNPTAKTVIDLLVQKFTDNKTLPNQAFNLQLLKMLAKAVDPEMPVNYISASTREKFPETTGPARGLFTMRGDKEQIFVLGPEFENSGLTVETLLHELTHAAVTKKIYSSDTDMKPYVDELYELLEKAKALVDSKEFRKVNGTAWDYAVSSLDEMIAFGMTNDLFQQRVLAQLTLESKVTGFKSFIQNLTKILFGGWAQKPEINTGMEVMIGNVTNLMALATQAKAKTGKDITLGIASEQAQQDAINSYSTLDIFNAIDNGTLDTKFQDQLRDLLGGMVEKLHGPFGAFKAAMRKTEAGNPMAVWLKALETGKAPFASSILASGFTGNNQQDFVLEQVEATVNAALNSGDTSTKEAYRELAALYAETYARLKPADFLNGDFKTNTMDEAQAMYDFVFKLEKTNGDRSDYLARFAALGLAHQGFNKLLQVPTEPDSRKKAKSFTERLQNVFEAILEIWQRKITRTYSGQQADERLVALVDQLVDIEAKKRHAIVREANGNRPFMEPIEEAAKKMADKASNKVIDLLNSPAVRTSGNNFVRAAGAVGRTIAGNRVPQFLEAMTGYRDAQFKGQLGVVGGIINNIKGPNEAFALLLRGSKQNERNRKQEITFKSKFVRESFANKGKDLKAKAKEAISVVFLRTGAHTLLDHFSMAEIEDLLGNKQALDAAITQFEDKLDVFGKYKAAFIEDANGLGHYKAVGVNKVLVMKMNAYAIARRFGSTDTTLTEAQTQQAEAIIAPLATLFALRYTPVEQMTAAKSVLSTENARKDNNGVEFALQLAKKLEEESLARLFKSNPALMVHGFTPEIYNYRTKLVTANELEGKGLVDQGYSKGAQVPKDPADPDTEVRHLYRLADGGMSPHLTGVIGYDSKVAKGSEVHSGYTNVGTPNGVMNASAQAAINTHRANAQTAGANPSRDLSKEKGSYMAPVFNESGDLVNWRYLMSEHSKDTLLERDNAFDTVMGTLAGSIQGKQTTIEQNKTAIIAMQEQYESEYATRGASYLLVGPKSETEELRAVWALLPDETKQDVNNVWGTNGMMVRSDAMDLIFGYRKVSAATMFKNANAERDNLRALGLPTDIKSLKSINGGQQLIVQSVEWILTESARLSGKSRADAETYAKRAAMLVARSENIWQAVVSETKDLLVVKTGATLMGNIFSNFTMLYLQGVPVTDMVKYTLVAFKGATAHRADTEELDRLRTELATGYTQGRDNEIKRRILVLEDAITRNPVHELIEAGLMPTIVEDIAGEEDIYSFKSELTRKVEGVTSKLNPSVVGFVRGVYMTHDTKLYRGLSHITQMSDFLARYALYQHETTRKKDPVSKKDAIARASSAFVNYDVPMHRALQYSDDMGFTTFTKYFLYIQRELWRVTKENPLRVYSTLLLSQFMELGPIVLDSSLMAHAGNNPIRGGAAGYFSALDKLLTVSTALAIVK